jgi:autotransporter strand-loop-strand O-heptosyltransferase
MEKNKIIISFNGQPKVEIKGDNPKKYKIDFINGETNQTVYSTVIDNDMWTSCNQRWNIPWIIKINNKIVHKFDLTNKEVKVSLQSKAVGDTLAWTPQILEFQKKYKCKVTISTFHNEWFINHPKYKNIKFIKPGEDGEYYATFSLGWFMTKDKWDEGSYHPTKPNTIPLIQAATDILGLPYHEKNYGIKYKVKKRPIKEKYICIGPRSTAALKEWDYNYWQHLAEELNKLGYKVVSISKEGFKKQNIINKADMEWEDSINYLHHADLFIGLGSGLSWMNWALGKYTLMINNFNPYGFDFTQNLTQIQNHSVCNGCWADSRFQFNRGKWDWCPRHQGTLSEFICHKSITPDKVLEKVKYIIKHKLNEKNMG